MIAIRSRRLVKSIIHSLRHRAILYYGESSCSIFRSCTRTRAISSSVIDLIDKAGPALTSVLLLSAFQTNVSPPLLLEG